MAMFGAARQPGKGVDGTCPVIRLTRSYDTWQQVQLSRHGSIPAAIHGTKRLRVSKNDCVVTMCNSPFVVSLDQNKRQNVGTPSSDDTGPGSEERSYEQNWFPYEILRKPTHVAFCIARNHLLSAFQFSKMNP